LSTDADITGSFTMSILLAWLGVRRSGISFDNYAILHSYEDTARMAEIQDKIDPLAKTYIAPSSIKFDPNICGNIDSRVLSDECYRV
jgi:hypothetical protein